MDDFRKYLEERLSKAKHRLATAGDYRDWDDATEAGAIVGELQVLLQQFDNHTKPKHNHIVVLNGPPSAGKSTVAKYLVREHGFTLHKLAKPIKDMLRALPGITEEHIEGALKEVPTSALNGKSPRWAMQTLGKEWRKTMESDDPEALDFLCVLWKNGRPEGPVVVDDLRYPQEVSFFCELGAKILRVYRPNFKVEHTGHEAERHQLETDAVLINNGTVADLERQARNTLRSLDLEL